jgi:ubiquinone/menaquinone biosynthesis C-methylase UbiE
MNADNTKRFSNRVEDYIKYRPTYPNEMINILAKEIGLTNDKIIADIGSGTGISSVPFLKNKNRVFGVEPNKEMREAQELLLSEFSNFSSINGSAEETNLEDKSLDLIFCAQAFHWFDKEKSKSEFSRILKENGNLVFVWNSRSTKTEFQKEYEQILYDNIEEYKNVNHRNIDDLDIEKFFSPKSMKTYELANEQKFDLDGLKGRLQSSSYCPKEGQEYTKLMKEIDTLFEKHQKENIIKFNYETKIYWC